MKKSNFISVFAAVAIALAATMTSCGEVKKPNDKVVCGNDTYTFSLGEIVPDRSTNTTTVVLLTNGQQIKFKASASNLFGGGGGQIFNPVSPVKMKIVAGQKTVQCNNDIMLSGDKIVFTFDTLDAPDKIIVYSNDENKSTVAYDAKTKKIIFALMSIR